MKYYKIGKWKVLKKHGTLVVSTGKRDYIFQVSLKNPWWLPRHETNHIGICDLYGWLFFYFGWYHKENQ